METKASGKEIVKKSNGISMRKLRLLLLCVTVCTQVTVSWSQSKLAGSYGVSPDYQAFLEAIHAYQGPPIHELPLAIGRKAMEDMQFEENTAYEHELYYEHTTAVYQKDSAKIVVIKPKKLRRKKLPVLVYFHGGGWVFNSFKTHKRLLSTIAKKAKVAVVFVDYSRAPEASYPKANEEGVTVLRWIYQKGRSCFFDIGCPIGPLNPSFSLITRATSTEELPSTSFRPTSAPLSIKKLTISKLADLTA